MSKLSNSAKLFFRKYLPGLKMADKPKDSKNEGNTASGSSSSSVPSDFTVEALRRYLAEKLGFIDSEESTQDAEKVKVLEEISVDGVVNYLKSDKCKNVITMAGAGISTSAGIPDFRSPGSGLYHNLQKYNLPDPQAIFELGFFYENPRPFFVLAKELYPGSFKPTKSHYFIKMLQDKGLLLRHYTQNIDTLERVAGVPDEKLVEAHGTFHTGHCLECRTEYSLEWMKKEIFDDKIPTCEKCPGVVKPDIVFFGENLPTKFHTSMKVDFPKCDLLIILGSSLVVQPFASLIDRVPSSTPRLLINREKAGERSSIMSMIGMGGGLEFDAKDNIRDVLWIGDCDEGCQLLADKLGWGDDLKKLTEEEHKRIDAETEGASKKLETKTEKLETKTEKTSDEENAEASVQEKHHL